MVFWLKSEIVVGEMVQGRPSEEASGKPFGKDQLALGAKGRTTGSDRVFCGRDVEGFRKNGCRQNRVVNVGRRRKVRRSASKTGGVLGPFLSSST